MTDPTTSSQPSRVPTARRWADVLGVGVFAALLLAVLVLPTPAEEKPAAEESEPLSGFGIDDVRLFDGERTLAKADVWVDDGRIQAVAPDLNFPEGLEVIDGRGKTLLPGFFDAHVHTWGLARTDAVRFGVTTLLDQFTSPSELHSAKQDRDKGGTPGLADLYSAGILATAAGGHGTQFGLTFDTLKGPEDAESWVQARYDEGSDWIKIVVEHGWRGQLNTLDLPTAGAVIEAAHGKGLKAVVHVSRLDDALAVVKMGADGLVHIWRDRLPTDEEVAVFKQAGAFVIPTLVVVEGMADPSPSLMLADGDLGGGLTATQRTGLERRFPAGAAVDWQASLGSVERLAAAGVPILAGSDAPNPSTAMGFSLHRELQLLVAAGLSPEAALKAATVAAAEAFGVKGRGRVEAGFWADLILVDGDPTQDIGAAQNLLRVWKTGQPVSLTAPASDPAESASEDAVAQAPQETLLADFAEGMKSRYGAGWTQTTDQRMGGKSVVELQAKEGVLHVAGEVRAGAMFPWAGALVFLGDAPMGPIDVSSRQELAFRVRGDGRRYGVMIFTGAMQGVPPTQYFEAGEEWRQVALPFDKFSGADFSLLRGISWSAISPPGEFWFEIDDVELK